MGSDNQPSGKAGASTKAEEPGWADGLRQLYDSVVEEDLPDSFKDLLAKLDDSDEAQTTEGKS